MAKQLMHWGIQPDYVIGHSLGEYVAACISEVFSLKEGLRMVCLRGELMDKIEGGAMLSVGTSYENLAPMMHEKLSIGAYNADELCVVSGRAELVEELIVKLDAKDIHNRRLPVYTASHSEMMNAMKDEFEEELLKFEYKVGTIPLVSNVYGKVLDQDQIPDTPYWMDHLLGGVKFSQGIQSVLSKGDAIFIEVGPGRSLTTFLRQNAAYGPTHAAVNMIKHAKDAYDDVEFMLNGLGQIWASGVPVNWDAYFENEDRLKVSVPTYSFDKTSLPTRVKLSMESGFHVSTNEVDHDDYELQSEEPEAERATLSTSYVAPKTETEEMLTEVFQEFFEMSKIGITDSFMELGGDSLKGLTVISQIHKKIGIEIPPSEFFQHDTIKDLSGMIDGYLSKSETENSIVI